MTIIYLGEGTQGRGQWYIAVENAPETNTMFVGANTDVQYENVQLFAAAMSAGQAEVINQIPNTLITPPEFEVEGGFDQVAQILFDNSGVLLLNGTQIFIAYDGQALWAEGELEAAGRALVESLAAL